MHCMDVSFWIPAATYSPGERSSIWSRRVGANAFLPLPISLGFRLALSATGGAQLRPLTQVSCAYLRESSGGACGEGRQKSNSSACALLLLLDPGGYLLSRSVSTQVPSAYVGLTSVFGMRTGGTPQLNHRKGVVQKHLENCIKDNCFVIRFDQALDLLVSVSFIRYRTSTSDLSTMWSTWGLTALTAWEILS